MNAAPTTPELANDAQRGSHCVQRFVGRILCGDNCELLEQMPRDCIDLVVTSPPYDDLRTYGGHAWDFYGVAAQLKRVLKPGGVIVWVVNDQIIEGGESGTSMEQALHFRKIGLTLHDTMIYDKGKCVWPDALRYDQCWEYMFVLAKGKPNTVHQIRDRRNALASRMARSTGVKKNGELVKGESYKVAEIGKRLNIWTYSAPEPLERVGHPAPFPIALAKDHILSWSNPGDVVLDPFSGSGTTCKAAKELNRQWVGLEINPEYVRMAESRLLQDVLPLEARDIAPNIKADA